MTHPPREQIVAAIRDQQPSFDRLDPAFVVRRNIFALSMCISEASESAREVNNLIATLSKE
jgi:hypothetical protein